MMLFDDVALVLEGGGMRAAYSAGMVSALMEADLRFPFIAAVSAGGTIASCLLSDDRPRLRASFVTMAEEPDFGGLGHFLRGKGYFNARYIYEDACRPDGTIPFDWQGYLANDTDFAIGAFTRDTGEARWWTRKDVHSAEDMGRIVRASSSLPIMMPATWIGGTCYVDGGLSESIPLSPALVRSYKRFLIIRTQEATYRKKEGGPALLSRAVGLAYPHLGTAMRTRPARYNRELAYCHRLVDRGAAYMMHPAVMPVDRGELDPEAIGQAFDLGLAQGRRDLPQVLAFLKGDRP
ncbi:patatin family protein [Peptococcus simiae]|uniref:Patatin family protein n=1 Tax=Peptococcus simiae TaxID=1643805 RepID=A0ABW9GZN2_9FIRM